MNRTFLVALVWAAGCATTNAEPVNKGAAETLDQYERTGEVQSCLNLRQISSINAVDENTLLIKSGVNDYYVNDVKGRCHGATRNSTRFQYTTSLNQLCRNDILKIVDNGGDFIVGSCGVGSFEKLEKNAEEESQTDTGE